MQYRSQSTIEANAAISGGASDVAVYAMIAKALSVGRSKGGVLVDIGCGSGGLWPFVRDLFDHYIGIDLVQYPSFPKNLEFQIADLNKPLDHLPADIADVVVSAETIEHLENPRAFVRELVRLTKPGGWVIVTTPNQLSALSILSLIVKHRFNQFQDVHYPAHLTALLEADLRRIGSECGLERLAIEYSRRGRLALTRWHYPQPLSRIFPRSLSDNLMMAGRKSEEAIQDRRTNPTSNIANKTVS